MQRMLNPSSYTKHSSGSFRDSGLQCHSSKKPSESVAEKLTWSRNSSNIIVTELSSYSGNSNMKLPSPKQVLFSTVFSPAILLLLFGASNSMAQSSDKTDSTTKAQWISLFDGKTLDGWEKVGKAESHWAIEDGAMVGTGKQSMLVNTSGPYKNFRYRAEIKVNDGGNSGLYFRTTRKPSFSDGYEAQIDSTHTDPIRTGSLYGLCHVYEQLVAPDQWFTYEVEVKEDVWRGREITRIKVTVDGKELYEYLDFAKTYPAGHFAFQQHDPGSKVHIRKVEVMPLKD